MTADPRLTVDRKSGVRAQVSPEIFDPRKVDTNFLEADFEYFRVLEARGDV